MHAVGIKARFKNCNGKSNGSVWIARMFVQFHVSYFCCPSSVFSSTFILVYLFSSCFSMNG